MSWLAALPPTVRGILCMIAGTMLLTTQDGISKWLLDFHHAGEIMFVRSALAFLPIAVLVQMEGGAHVLRSRRPKVQALRAAVTLLTALLVILSFRYMPLADALAIVFVSPLFLTALSGPLLGEAVGWRRWCAVLVGFVGVLCITRPGAEGIFNAYMLIPLAAAFFVALRDILTRQLGAYDGPTSVLFWSMVATLVGGAASLPVFGGRLPAAEHWPAFAAGAVLVTLAHWFTIKGLHLAAAATLAPFKYLSLVWAGIIGFFVWGDVPDVWKLVGAVLVVGSGLYVLHRETRKKAGRPTDAEAMPGENAPAPSKGTD